MGRKISEPLVQATWWGLAIALVLIAVPVPIDVFADEPSPPIEGQSQTAQNHCQFLMICGRALSEARIEAERAVILDHNNSAALYELGLVHMYLGHPEAAIPHIEKAIRLSPRDPFLSAMHYGLGRCRLYLGHLDEAITLFEQVRTERPAYWDIHMWLAGALALNGDLDGARIELAELK